MRKPLSLLVLSLMLAGAPLALSQSGQPQPPPQSSTPPAQGQAQEDSPEFKLIRRVTLVSTPLVVYNRFGDYIYDLRREEITVLDNGIPQQIADFDLASQPISLVLLVNNSGTLAPLLQRIRQSAELFPTYILGPEGEGALVTFSDDITVRQNFTSNAEAFVRAVKHIPRGRDGARLADALEQAVAMLSERPEGRRRVIVVIGEARNRGSKTSERVPLQRAQLANISIYTIHLTELQADLRRKPEDSSPTAAQRTPFPPGVQPMPGPPGSIYTPTQDAQRQSEKADIGALGETIVRSGKDSVTDNVLQDYARGTGALHYSPSTVRGLEESLNLIGQDLHNQYQISYRPSNHDDTGYHRIEIKIARPGVRVRTRPGYFVGVPPS
ncbi:MAG TPA: VWA domain-containing protein [Candidatus Xenobia bacterium]|nr:VWA domain-containing protein [Candidatus Xenobia bacterium]